MTTVRDDRLPPKSRPGPKARGRTVVPMTITVTPAQRAALEAIADAEGVSISTVIRRFIAVGLVAGGLYILTALIETTITRRTGTKVSRGSHRRSAVRGTAKEQAHG